MKNHDFEDKNKKKHFYRCYKNKTRDESWSPILFLRFRFLFRGSDITVCPIPAPFGRSSDVSSSRILFCVPSNFKFALLFYSIRGHFINQSIIYRIKAGFYCYGTFHFLSNEPNMKTWLTRRIHSAREERPCSSGKARTRLPIEWARFEEVERALRGFASWELASSVLGGGQGVVLALVMQGLAIAWLL